MRGRDFRKCRHHPVCCVRRIGDLLAYSDANCDLSAVNGIAFDYLLLAWVLVSTTAVGVAICSRWSSLNGVRLLGYGIAAGVAVHGVVGLLIALCWPTRVAVACVPIALALLALADLHRCGAWRLLFTSMTKPQRISLLVWLAFVVGCVGLVHADVRWPATLQDGRFVFKKHRLNTKVQYLTSLPTDNYIPYVVIEFFARGLSFSEHRPILPGNEVSNRTILMSLVALPFRTILGAPAQRQTTLGEFRYVGKQWPDVESLNDDGSFEQSLIIGLYLNSLLLLGLIVFCSSDPAARVLPTAALLFATNQYFIRQTIFTWPKALAGFFLVLAWDCLRRNGSVAAAAACAALAYNSHPSSIAACAGLGAWVVWRARGTSEWWRQPICFGGVALLITLPWLIWTTVVLRIPSDMLWQNFASPSSAVAMGSIVNFGWVRIVNVFSTLMPSALTVYPFNLASVLDFTGLSLPLSVGLLLIIPAFREVEALWSKEPVLVVFAFAVPAAALVLLFSYPAAPVLHGLQPIIGILLFLAVLRLHRTVSPRAFTTIVVLQLLANFALLAMHACLVGLH